MECTFFTSGPRLEGRGGDAFFWDVVCSPTTDRGEGCIWWTHSKQKKFEVWSFFQVLSTSRTSTLGFLPFHKGVYGELKFHRE